MSRIPSIVVAFAAATLLANTTPLHAQDSATVAAKLPIYGSISVGFGNTFFSGTLGAKETANDSRGYGRNQGNTLATWFYAAPTRWRGLGVGAGVKGFIASPNKGGNNEEYFFNYYHVGLGAKYYPISRTFNRGWLVKGSVGFGQMTEKTRFNNTNTYEHQFAIGTTLLGGIGYSFPLRSGLSAFNIELDFETSNRNGDVTGVGQGQSFRNSHVSLNMGVTF